MFKANYNELRRLRIQQHKTSCKNLSDVDNFELGGIIAEHKEHCMVGTQKGEMEAEITGNMR